MVIGLLVPIVLSAKVAAALAVERVTVSEPCLPANAAEPLTNRSVAETVES